MTYDFTTLMDRKGKDAVALDVDQAISGGNLAHTNIKIRDGFSVIPMWVADMNQPLSKNCKVEWRTRLSAISDQPKNTLTQLSTGTVIATVSRE